MSCSSIFFFHGTAAPSRPGPRHCWGFMIIHRHTTLGRAPLDEWSAERRDLYLTTHSTHKRHTCIPMWGFKPSIPARECPQTHTSDCVATGSFNPLLSWHGKQPGFGRSRGTIMWKKSMRELYRKAGLLSFGLWHRVVWSTGRKVTAIFFC